jgi:hypothetical protein
LFPVPLSWPNSAWRETARGLRSLTRLLQALARDHPTEGWDQYLTNGTPNWPKIALTGQSQGAGMAAYIAKRVKLARVILSSSPWDHSVAPPSTAKPPR